MARYAELYHRAIEDLERAREALAKSEHDRESYRTFIQETGRTSEYMIWWGRKQGFTDETMKSLERAFATCQRGHDPNETTISALQAAERGEFDDKRSGD